MNDNDTLQPKRLSVVIPTWNRKYLVVTCLGTLTKQTYRDFEVIVVDDGSTDDTAGLIERDFPWVRLVRLETNSGFCVATNSGIRHARGELILLLNNDIFLEPDFLQKLVDAADSSQAAMFAPLLLWRDEPEVIYSAGDRQRLNGRPEPIGFRCVLKGFRFPDAIFGVSAAAGLYRREIFDTVGLLDERFIAYFEDSDLCFRARMAGFAAQFVPAAVAYHIGSASIEDRAWWRTKQCCRNHALLVVKDMPLELLLRFAIPILAERIHQVLRLFTIARCEFGAGRALYEVASMGWSLAKAMPGMWFSRWKIQRTRTISAEELEALLSE